MTETTGNGNSKTWISAVEGMLTSAGFSDKSPAHMITAPAPLVVPPGVKINSDFSINLTTPGLRTAHYRHLGEIGNADGRIRIECYWQDVSGSTWKKLYKAVADATMAPEPVVFMVLGGNGWPKKDIEFLQLLINRSPKSPPFNIPDGKRIILANRDEFEGWIGVMRVAMKSSEEATANSSVTATGEAKETAKDGSIKPPSAITLPSFTNEEIQGMSQEEAKRYATANLTRALQLFERLDQHGKLTGGRQARQSLADMAGKFIDEQWTGAKQ